MLRPIEKRNATRHNEEVRKYPKILPEHVDALEREGVKHESAEKRNRRNQALESPVAEPDSLEECSSEWAGGHFLRQCIPRDALCSVTCVWLVEPLSRRRAEPREATVHGNIFSGRRARVILNHEGKRLNNMWKFDAFGGMALRAAGPAV